MVLVSCEFSEKGTGRNSSSGRESAEVLLSQHCYAKQFIGEAYVYTLNIEDLDKFRTTIQKILDTGHGFLTYKFTEEGLTKRMNVYIKHQNFRQFQKKLTKWLHDQICEPGHFLETNANGALKLYSATCVANRTIMDIFYTCASNQDPQSHQPREGSSL